MKIINVAYLFVTFALTSVLVAGEVKAGHLVVKDTTIVEPYTAIMALTSITPPPNARPINICVVEPGTQFCVTSYSTTAAPTPQDIYHNPTTCPSGMYPTYTDPKGGHIMCAAGSTSHIPIIFMVLAFIGGVLILISKPLF